MGTNQASGDKSRVSAKIPTNQKEAVFLLAKHRSAQQRKNVSMAEIVREFIREGLAREDDLPEEVQELLDEPEVGDA
jgi:hypothetical protein